MFLLMSVKLLSQEKYQQTRLEFDDALNAEESYVCVATSTIELQPGFSYKPILNNAMSLEIDRYSVFPPSEGVSGGPLPNDDGVVAFLRGTFDVGNTGSAVYSIDIDLPSATGNMMPQLSVTYNNQSANGLLGWAWNLAGLSIIERVGQTEYHDGKTTGVDLKDDRYVLDGQRLLSVGENTYKTEVDNMSKIKSYHKDKKGPDSFVVWKSDGTIWEYGTTEDSKVEPQNSDDVILKWRLSRILDRNGNSIEYNYYENKENGESYINSIDYTRNKNASLQPVYKVQFVYHDKECDQQYKYVYGNLVSDKRLLKGIEVYNNYTKDKIIEYTFDYHKPGYYGNDYFMHYRLSSVGLIIDGKKVNPTRILWNSKRKHYPDNVNGYKKVELNKTVFRDVPFVGDFNGDGFSDVLTVPYKVQNSYSATVPGKVYLNNGDGTFQDVPMTTISFDKNLDWIYVVDLDGDGVDDIVPYEVCRNADNIVESVKFSVKLMEDGTFVEKVSYRYDDYKVLIPGCYLGTDDCGILVLDAYDGTNNKKMSNYIGYKNGKFINTIIDNSNAINGKDVDNIVVDMSGDGVSELLSLEEKGFKVYRLNGESSLKLELLAQGESMTKDIYPFPNDYNGDGKTDVLYYDKKKYWNMVLSTGKSYTRSMSCTDNNLLRSVVLNPKDRYTRSLKEMSEPSVAIRTADFDGDGVADVGVFKNYGGNHYLEVGFLPHKANDEKYRFSYQRRFYMPINYSHHTIHLGRFLPQDNISVLSGLPQNPHSAEKAYVTSLYSNSIYYSVERIIDGMGNSRGLSYEYLMQNSKKNGGFYTCTGDVTYHNVVRKSVPLLALKTDTIYNVNGVPVVNEYSYHNAMIHKKGHGFIGFERVTARNYVNGKLFQKRIECFSLNSMGEHCVPTLDLVRLYHGEDQLIQEKCFYYGKFKCVSNEKVFMPLLKKEQDVIYDKDKSGTIQKNIISNNDYKSDVSSGNLYENVVQLVASQTGYDGDALTSDPRNCPYWEESFVVFDCDIDNWIINRPKEVVNANFDANNDVVGDMQLLEYYEDAPGRIRCKINVPNINANMRDSLITRTEYKYDAFGNVVEQTLSSPSLKYDKTVKSEYGSDYQFRYKTKSEDELGREIRCEYDGSYGLMTSTTDYNNLTTHMKKDPAGNEDEVSLPDGMKHIKVLRWVNDNKYAPSRSAYYSWEKSTGGAEKMVFYHRTGLELRAVSFDINGDVIFVDKFYDDYGNLKKESLPYYQNHEKYYVVNNYDEYNRLIAKCYPSGMITNYKYDGKVIYTETVALDAKKQCQKDTYNVMGWLVSTTDNGGNEIKYEYYCDGRVKSAQIGNNKLNRIEVTYDNLRNRQSLYDPNYGLILYKNNALGHIVRITKPKCDVVDFEYDVLGRMIRRIDVDNKNKNKKERYVQWFYDNGNAHNGLLTKISTSDGHLIEYSYDDKLRVVGTTETIKGMAYKSLYSYDEANRVVVETYPSGFSVSRQYSNTGYEKTIRNVKDDAVLWKTNKTNSSGLVTEYCLGNGLKTSYSYNPSTLLLEKIQTKKGNEILQNLSYRYDGLGNMVRRSKLGDNVVVEDFEYDSYDRLTRVTLDQNETCVMVYDNLGNICEKEVDGVKMLYNVAYDIKRPNAMVNAKSDDKKMYDKAKQEMEYSLFDNLLSIRENDKSLHMVYGYDENRIAMELRCGTDVKSKIYVGNCEFVEENAERKVLTYLEGPTGFFAIHTTDDSGNASLDYVNKDNLGSWNVITDEDGKLLQELSFDAWGNLRNPDTWNGLYEAKMLYDKGYTGHEHIAEFELINMNGRIYDPFMSMMLSPDNNIQLPKYSQNFNRYCYCLNNPLKYNDPSGEFVESVAFGIVGGAANVVLNAKNIDSFGEGMLLFGAGFAKGFLMEYTMGQSWFLQVGLGALAEGLKSGVNQMVALGNGSFKFSGDEWNSIKTSSLYGLGSGLMTSVMEVYIDVPTEEDSGMRLTHLFEHDESANVFTSLTSHAMGCWFSGQSFIGTMRLTDMGMDLEMLGYVAKRLLESYMFGTDFCDKAIKQRGQDIKDSMLKDILSEDPDYPDFEHTYKLSYVELVRGRLYVVGNVFAYLPGIMRETYKKPYFSEVVSFPFSYSLFRSIFFNNNE